MKTLSIYYNAQRQTVIGMKDANKLDARTAMRLHQDGAVELLGKLRSGIKSIETKIANVNCLEPTFQDQVEAWDDLHTAAMETVAAFFESGREAFQREEPQSALSA